MYIYNFNICNNANIYTVHFVYNIYKYLFIYKAWIHVP